MPNQDEHILQAKHNRDFWISLELSSTLFLDWVVTGIFYEGVHWMEAFLSSRGEHPLTHKQRLFAMQRNNNETYPIKVDLEILKTESENARYKCYKHQPNDISNDLIPLVNNIQNHVQKLLNKSSPTQP